MSISINNAGQQNLSALVTQLGDTKDSKELRSGTDKLTGVTALYVKTNWSTGMLAMGEKRIERATSQQNARVDILKALHNEFPAVAEKVLINMKSFFSGAGKVTAADARAVLANALSTAARSAEVGIAANLFDTQNHPQVAQLFSAFLRKEHSHENYDFVLAVRAHRAIPEDANGGTQKTASAAALLARFGPGKEEWVNLPNTEKLSRLVDDGVSAAQKNDLLDTVEASIIKLAAVDSGARFIKTGPVQDYINKG